MKLIIKNTYKCKDGRWRAYCVDENNKAHIISYPRILVEEKLGRPLKPDEDIHHIDGNPDNNDINNLEVIMHGEHQREHSTKYFNTVEMCIICGTAFIMEGYKWSRIFNDLKRNRIRYLTCSKSCAGKLSSNKYPLLYDIEERLNDVEKLWNE